ncbi:MAG: hypothetical protein D3925_15290, partial [Candidatus Electrothrix sp. AR5]|nr:hypothetical protein [Candidatus Electrothrix sp. AR5]
MTSRSIQVLTVLLFPLILLSMLPLAATAGGRKPKLKPIPQKTKPVLRSDAMVEAPPKYIRMADNFFVFYDPSTVMTVPYKNTGMTRLEMSKQILLKSNAAMPDLRWQTGLYPQN